jgi:hypothetical protein
MHRRKKEEQPRNKKKGLSQGDEMILSTKVLLLSLLCASIDDKLLPLCFCLLLCPVHRHVVAILISRVQNLSDADCLLHALVVEAVVVNIFLLVETCLLVEIFLVVEICDHSVAAALRISYRNVHLFHSQAEVEEEGHTTAEEVAKVHTVEEAEDTVLDLRRGKGEVSDLDRSADHGVCHAPDLCHHDLFLCLYLSRDDGRYEYLGCRDRRDDHEIDLCLLTLLPLVRPCLGILVQNDQCSDKESNEILQALFFHDLDH